MRLRRAVMLAGLAIACAAAPALASGKKELAAVQKLEAAYAASAKLAGAARTDRACADADPLRAAAEALPAKRAPSGAAVDDLTWRAAVDGLQAVVGTLGKVCKAPDRKIAIDLQGKKFETADQVVERLATEVTAVLERARARTLPPAMRKFQTTMAGLRVASKKLCAQHGALAKLVPAMATPPTGADPAKWQHAAAQLTSRLDELKQFGCATPRGADEEIAGALNELHDRYFELVLLAPPRA